MKTRILTSLVGIPLALVLLFWPGGRPWVAAVAVVGIIASLEYASALAGRGIAILGPVLVVGAVAFPIGAAYPAETPLLSGLLWLATLDISRGPTGWGLLYVAAAMLVVELFRHDRAPLRNVGATLFGLIWIPALLSALAALRSGAFFPGAPEKAGAWAVLSVLLVIWAGDTAAYFTGRAWGRRKCAPSISPNKTWEGVFGGLAASAAFGALALAPTLAAPGLGFGAGRGTALGLAFGLLVGAAGQVGDLVESAVKREIGIKDFGEILPGHGGVLDRFDSLLFAAPVACLLLRWMAALAMPGF